MKVNGLAYPSIKADIDLCYKQLHEICQGGRGCAVMSVPPAPTDFDMQMSAAFDELKAYRATGLTPEQVADLSRAKQEGRLIELPCKVGDTVYFAVPGCKVSDAKVTGFWIADKWLQLQLSNGSTFTCWDGPNVYFGRTVFLTREAAEAEKEREKQCTI